MLQTDRVVSVPTDSLNEAQTELETLASQLAQTQKNVRKSKGVKLPLLKNPERQEVLLTQAHQHYGLVAEQELTISHAGEWLLDNFYVVQQSLRQVIEDIPNHFYNELPKLTQAPLEGFPRIYAIARTLADWSVNPFTMEQINLFIHAYQEITPLTMGELWALPAILRATNLENLIWVIGELIGIEEAHSIILEGVRLPEHPAEETQVANAIINLRMLAAQDWKLYFESVSHVERILRLDPAGVYSQMDFETRNRYRHIIEAIAPNTGRDEERVAEAAISLAQRSTENKRDAQLNRDHVGYYLLDAGRGQLAAEIGYRPTLKDRLHHLKEKYPTALYIGAIGLFMLAIMLSIEAYASRVGETPLQVILILVLALLPASAMAINIINWSISQLVQPSVLPKMDFKDGVPADYRTMIVIPALLSDTAEMDSLGQQLELHYLRNNDSAFSFALLADYLDAPQQHMPDDNALLEHAQNCIRLLNDRYGTPDRKPFYLFLRERRWNASEDTWMGWERKRGKLMEFNHLLLDSSAETSYFVREGDLSILQSIRYVITLDADTILPRDSAARLVAILAHPLNHAQFDKNNHVTSGYTVLQPRVEIGPTAANRTRFTRVFSGDTGVDLYTMAVSDVYQDWFGEGIFTGKGIYDVAAFDRSLKGRVPENTLLSHDLFEGLHGRAALVTDVVMLEDYPPHYLVHTLRLHRWIRGDWQLLRWLLPYVPLADGEMARNPLGVIDRWKLLDNLRRSLIAPAMLLLFVGGWLFLPGSPLFYTLFALLVSMTPFFMGLLNIIGDRIRDGSWESSLSQFRTNLSRWILSLAFLPYEALLALNAIVTTLQRLIKRQHMLQWTTAAHATRSFAGKAVRGFVWRQMFRSVAFVLGLGILVALVHRPALGVSAPILILWLVSPLIADWLSQPITHASALLSGNQQKTLRTLARRTWLFFEQFVGPEDHWLPPDHFQESPYGIIAHSTSPTNIGLMLLSTLAAYDFGYMGLIELSARLKLTFETLEQLERYRGHFLNWYDTRTLTPLPPRYVSTVDSGNLVCSLLALNQGLKELSNAPVIRPERWQGLLDTLSIIEGALSAFSATESRSKADHLITQLSEIRLHVLAVQYDVETQTQYLTELTYTIWPEITQLLVEILESESEGVDIAQLSVLRVYAERMNYHLNTMQRDTTLLVPWLRLMSEPPDLFSAPTLSAGISEAWRGLLMALPRVPRFGAVSEAYEGGHKQLRLLQEHLTEMSDSASVQAAQRWCSQLSAELDEAQFGAENLLADFQSLGRQIENYVETMDFGFLFNTQRKLFHIGYNVTVERLDNSFYDLLASEARLTSLFAIATEQVPQEHWLHLGRPQTRVEGMQTLLSWSGTMFEYLMPGLLMQNYTGTLLDQSSIAAVNAQIAYGRQKHIPWGISESGYYAFDGNQNYQYRAFGVPNMALKRGLAADMVIAPYAAVMALPINPASVLNNMHTLTAVGALGMYGYYEAIDYTATRLALGQNDAIVREYMSHHQGMIMLTLLNSLSDNVMVRRFHSDSRIQSVELLLQEQIPKIVDLQQSSSERTNLVHSNQPHVNTAPWNVSPTAPVPQVHYLSNGSYGVLITSAGSGYSQWQDMALTRWRADTTLEDRGNWVYVRDQDTGNLWSVTNQPMSAAPDYQNVVFYPHKVEFQRRDQDILVQMEITVPPDDDLEIRRIRLTNQGDTPRHLLLSSYAEVILSAQAGDQQHPAFNKMFIESEYLPKVNGLLFRRRPRSASEAPVNMIHMLVREPGGEVAPNYETDRARFLGRGRTPAAPEALTQENGLSDTTGATLDPIMALSQEFIIEPHASVQVAYITLAADTRGKAIALARTYQIWSTLDRAFDQMRYRNEQEMRQLGIHSPDIQQFQKMLSALLYPQAALRGSAGALSANSKGQTGLWMHGISGDYPIIVVKVSDEAETALVHDLIQAHKYWRNRKIKVTLVILNQRDTGYTQELYNQMHRLIVRTGSETWINRHDGIFLLRGDLLNDSDQALLIAAARVYLDGSKGSLREQLETSDRQPIYLPSFIASLPVDAIESTPAITRPDNLLFDNGMGGFTPDGREYVIYRQAGQVTPAPWINVIANPEFGFTVSESGGGFTWAGNSSENRLTSWRNDPVTDMPSEAIYLRDEETAQIWSPIPLPAGTNEPYLIRHGKGYSTFEHHSHGVKQLTTLFVPKDASVKIIALRLENTSKRARRITATYYAEIVLGTAKDICQQYVIPEFDSTSQTVLFHNPYSIDFGGQFAFITANKTFHGLTTDRSEFLGRLGNYHYPAALRRIGLSGTVQAGADPCGAVQLHVDLNPGESEEVYFLIGEAKNRDSALQLAQQYRAIAEIEKAWKAMNTFWDETLTSITAQTPEPAMNMLLPWMLYQTLTCRIWGRSALYQSSGAFGFRDQLQDVMALLHVHPDITREHILEAARHQFEAGDVLHWWHPPTGRGVRTHISDDLVWLPYVVSHYIASTGDDAILQEKLPFLKGEPVKKDEENRYGNFESTTEEFTLYEHCRRALNKSLPAGSHGLPLMGGGDWNDGMNLVGIGGKGESVWLGWFLYTTLSQFIAICERMEDPSQADAYRLRMDELLAALEQSSWDGQWYLRAFYDDGSRLGSTQNNECQIDSIPQSWAAISKAADSSRAQSAMDSVIEKLVKKDDQLIELFTPPFDKTERNPGYIKGYPPGIRENGGQYTHAAIWTAWAFTEMGQGDQAEELFRLLNPIYHSDSPEKAQRYRVEPYVIAADVYSEPPHVGRGGWTWYTGSSGWMYRLGIEAILGLHREGDSLRIDPCIPKGWTGFEITYRFGQTSYHIKVENPSGVSRGVKQVTLDGETLTNLVIPLKDENRQRKVVVTLG